MLVGTVTGAIGMIERVPSREEIRECHESASLSALLIQDVFFTDRLRRQHIETSRLRNGTKVRPPVKSVIHFLVWLNTSIVLLTYLLTHSLNNQLTY